MRAVMAAVGVRLTYETTAGLLKGVIRQLPISEIMLILWTVDPRDWCRGLTTIPEVNVSSSCYLFGLKAFSTALN